MDVLIKLASILIEYILIIWGLSFGENIVKKDKKWCIGTNIFMGGLYVIFSYYYNPINSRGYIIKILLEIGFFSLYFIIQNGHSKGVFILANICSFEIMHEIINMVSVTMSVLIAWIFAIELESGKKWLCIMLRIVLMVAILKRMRKPLLNKAITYTSSCIVVTTYIIVICMKIPFLFTEIYDVKYLKATILTLFVATAVFIVISKIDKYNANKEKLKIEEDNKRLAAQLHKSKEILPAMVSVLAEVTEKSGAEMEEGKAQELLQEVCDLYGQQLKENSREDLEFKNFCSTGLKVLDQQLLGYLQEAAELNINMDIYIPIPISTILRKSGIDQLRFQRAVGDMVRNAFRAIKRQCQTKGQILLVIGCRYENIIEISVMDNGADFPLQVLESFGKRGISTGGTGNGLADLVEFACDMDASILVEEFGEETNVFTKSFSMIFDRNQSFRLLSSRKAFVGNALWCEG